MSDWQPIETAPKDGTGILVYCADGITTAAWGPPNLDGGHWYLLVLPGWAEEDSFGRPTHWMPLPAPPAK